MLALDFYGIKLDAEINAKTRLQGDIVKISAEDSKVPVYVIPTNEELVIAADTERLVKER